MTARINLLALRSTWQKRFTATAESVLYGISFTTSMVRWAGSSTPFDEMGIADDTLVNLTDVFATIVDLVGDLAPGCLTALAATVSASCLRFGPRARHCGKQRHRQRQRYHRHPQRRAENGLKLRPRGIPG